MKLNWHSAEYMTHTPLDSLNCQIPRTNRGAYQNDTPETLMV